MQRRERVPSRRLMQALAVVAALAGWSAPPTAAELTIETEILPDARVGSEYSAKLEATGSDGTVTWRVRGLPEGLSLDSSSGEISGRPDEPGHYEPVFTATATAPPAAEESDAAGEDAAEEDEDDAGEATTAERTLELAVYRALEASPISRGDVSKAPPGEPFDVEVTVPAKLDAELGELVYSLHFGPNRVEPRESAITGPEKVTDDGHVFEITAVVPAYQEIFGEPDFFEGALGARRAEVEVEAGILEQTPWRSELDLHVSSRFWGTFWGLLVILGLFLVIGLMKPRFPTDARFDEAKDSREARWKEKSQGARVLQAPLRFCVTPIDTYSISLAQVLFWTAVVIFSATYVAFVRGGFLALTEQYLGLLGIAGGTAIAAKANAVIRSRDIPAKYLEGIERDRTPKLSDLISSGGTPNIFKFQMFAFTLINGVIVLGRVYAEFGLPEIPAEQLTLMGVSSGVYLGNEMVVENIWEKIDTKVKEAEKLDPNTQQTEYEDKKEEIQDLLRQVYS